ncbi:MAG: ankyrin repeat-containing protein ITN1-like [Chlamydiales bacterium]|jgi:hypothetical protein|nr:ankyrin repeat-containing protein ITN1-like [Chlamydiales bacterium]
MNNVNSNYLYITDLPYEDLEKILSYLDLKGFLNLIPVNKKVKELVTPYFEKQLREYFFPKSSHGTLSGMMKFAKDNNKLALKSSIILYNTKPQINAGFFIDRAYSTAYLKVAEELLNDPRFDPSVGENCFIQDASKRGDLELVKKLLKDPRVDPSNNDNIALYWAASRGHLGVVKELLKDPRVDPSTQQNSVLIIEIAALKGHLDVVEELLEDPRVSPVKDNVDNPVLNLIAIYCCDIKEGNNPLEKDEDSLFYEISKIDLEVGIAYIEKGVELLKKLLLFRSVRDKIFANSKEMEIKNKERIKSLVGTDVFNKIMAEPAIER